MKHLVDEIICTFSKEEYREFKYFLQRNASITPDSPEIKFAELVRTGKIKSLKHTNHLSQMRKQLQPKIRQFAMLENMRKDSISDIHSMLEMAKYLFRKNLYNQAWKYLFKAEEDALKAEDYELLNSIYYTQILYAADVYAPKYSDLNILSIVDKHRKNMLYAESDNKVNTAYALLIYEIEKSFSNKVHVDIDVLVKNILSEYELEQMWHANPKIYMKMAKIVCTILREKEEHAKLKDYSMNSYAYLAENNLLDKVYPDLTMDILLFAQIGTIRTKDYVNCEKVILLYKRNIERFRHEQDKYLYYIFINGIDTADLYLYTNRLHEAKQLLTSLYDKYEGYTQSLRIYYILRANVLAVHFKYEDYVVCIKIINDMINQPARIVAKEQGFGVEVVFLTELYRVILYYENNDSDYAYMLLKSIRKKYSNLLASPELKREKMFIKIMEQLCDDSSYIKSSMFITVYNKFIRMKEYIPGAKEYISLNAWLTSKLTGKTYYECFLELVK